MRTRDGFGLAGPSTADASGDGLADRAETLYREGQTQQVVDSTLELAPTIADAALARLRTIRGMALFDTGNVVASLDTLADAIEIARRVSPRAEFDATFSRFVRATDFQAPSETLPGLASLRVLASQLGEAHSVSSLHLAVARLEGLRGHYVDAHRHLEIARRYSTESTQVATRCSVDLVEGSLEILAGNLVRARGLADDCFRRADAAGFNKYVAGSLTNLAAIALYRGNLRKADVHLGDVMRIATGLTYVRLGALDTMVQVALQRSELSQAKSLLEQCADVVANDHLPGRSWYDLAHQATRCAYFEQLEDWPRILEICGDADPELARRQYKAVRTTLLCARARASAWLGRTADADAALAAAVRVCPRGAVDPLIVLEATKGLCASLRGETTRAATHFDRALAACRAIGHTYHETWIDRQRADVARVVRDTVVVPRRELDVTETALLMTDVATVIGAGHSIDLLAHRMAAILKSTALGPRVEIDDQSGCDYVADPSAAWEAGADGTFQIALRGSDRHVTIRVRGVQTIDEISLLKSVADLVQAAVNRTADTETEDEDQTLWPRALGVGTDDTIFRSPRMLELLRVTMRLAASDLPILITGETGTGKEIIARLIHDHSPMKRGPFFPFNMSSIPREMVESQLFGHRRGAFTGATDAFPGVIRAAAQGTLFLDEIGELDPTTQPKLLRFLETGEIHPLGESRPQKVLVRLVAATNADLDRMVEDGRFRRDLIYRLGVARIALPPLRERKDEIPALAALFASRFGREAGRTGVRLGDDCIAAMLLYDWPGNIRQLFNEIRRLVALAEDGETITVTNLSPEIIEQWAARTPVARAAEGPVIQVRLGQPLAEAVAELEHRFIEHALRLSSGRVADAAQLLGLSRKGLFLKRRRRGLIAG